MRRARKQSLLSESQLAELAELPRSESRKVRAAARMEILMDEIRALGHSPRESPTHREEYNLFYRLRYAKAHSHLSESQLAELAEIARTSDEPVRKRLRVMDD